MKMILRKAKLFSGVTVRNGTTENRMPRKIPRGAVTLSDSKEMTATFVSSAGLLFPHTFWTIAERPLASRGEGTIRLCCPSIVLVIVPRDARVWWSFVSIVPRSEPGELSRDHRLTTSRMSINTVSHTFFFSSFV
jgi:hypothetical protein